MADCCDAVAEVARLRAELAEERDALTVVVEAVLEVTE